ncbi:hypothetical protein OIV48_31060, partial [Burkholderia pseudomallei]|nr:hypothetical protein [Burkholderia pseudomallei]
PRELSGAWPASLSPISLLDRAFAVDAPDTNFAPAHAQSVDLSNTRTHPAAFFSLCCSVTWHWLGHAPGVRATAVPVSLPPLLAPLPLLPSLFLSPSFSFLLPFSPSSFSSLFSFSLLFFLLSFLRLLP